MKHWSKFKVWAVFRPLAALISKNKSDSTQNTTAHLKSSSTSLWKWKFDFFPWFCCYMWIISSDMSLKASLSSLFLLTCAVKNYPSHFIQPTFSTTDLVNFTGSRSRRPFPRDDHQQKSHGGLFRSLWMSDRCNKCAQLEACFQTHCA